MCHKHEHPPSHVPLNFTLNLWERKKRNHKKLKVEEKKPEEPKKEEEKKEGEKATEEKKPEESKNRSSFTSKDFQVLKMVVTDCNLTRGREERTASSYHSDSEVHMHCEACSQEIKRRIERIKGVESAEPDLKNSLVTVKEYLKVRKRSCRGDGKQGGGGGGNGGGGGGGEETTVVEVKKNEYYYNPPRYGMEFYAYPGPAYPPQIFSDENPNACSIM
ncbi:unnamed protein product [Vicia faba]|uniref:HMA domain-containing protein n=1 Tax=Vicia faba TaxID=3906 RepID=A0AAV1B9W9_VICFA|nr:unnamed protein product [Vicia faba]